MNTPQHLVPAMPQPHFPADIWQQLGGNDYRLLDEIAYLCRLTAKKSPSGAKYCFPGQKYLAEKLKVSIYTISRHISKLASLGILDVTHRRQVKGTWRTNLYRIRNWTAWKMTSLLHRTRSLFSPVALSRKHSFSQKRDSDQIHDIPAKTSGNAILQAWMKRGLGGKGTV